MMGVSMALYEEAKFDQSGVTVEDWTSYPILKMADIPEVKVVLVHRPEGGQLMARVPKAPTPWRRRRSPWPSSMPPEKMMRRLPMKPDYVKAALGV